MLSKSIKVRGLCHITEYFLGNLRGIEGTWNAMQSLFQTEAFISDSFPKTLPDNVELMETFLLF
jgi:hypothetical protein